MSISCSPWAADGCLVHTSCRSCFSHLFGRAQPVQLMLMMRDPRASIMNISCSPSSLASPPFQHRREFLAFLGQRSAPNVACIVQSAFLAAFTALSTFSEARSQHHEHQLLPLGVLSQSFRALFRPGDRHHEHQLLPLGPHGRSG